MPLPLRSLPVLAVALLAHDAAAQSAVQMTPLHVQRTAVFDDAAPRATGRFSTTPPLASGDVRVWTGAVSPVWAPVAPPDVEPVAKTTDLPTELALRPAFPNPVSARATVPFDLPTAGHVRVGLYDVLGRQVAVVLDEARDAGRHTAALETTGLAPGVYFLRLATGDAALVSRLTVVR